MDAPLELSCARLTRSFLGETASTGVHCYESERVINLAEPDQPNQSQITRSRSLL